MFARPLIVFSLLCIALAACGGGGGGGGPTVSAPAPSPGGGGNPAPRPDTPGPGATPEQPPSNPVTPVPSAGQAFRGQNTLETKLSGVTRSGKILVIDSTCGQTDSQHCDRVKRVMTDIGVLDGDIVEGPELIGRTIGDESTYRRFRLFNDDMYATLRTELRVVVMPISLTFIEPGTANAVMANNVVFIASAGNTPLHPGTGAPIPAGRDLYSSANPSWAYLDLVDWGVPHSLLKETLDTLRTGKALFVTWGNMNRAGEIVPYDFAVKCGDAMEWCLTAILPPDYREDPVAGNAIGTSFASPIVAAAAYYLSQLWDQAEDIVSTLKTCAIDVGAAGTDEEFGVGVVNVDCPTVASRELGTARASMRTETRSPLMDSQGQSGPHSPSASAPVFGFTREGEKRSLGGFVVPEIYLSERYRALGASMPFATGELTGVWGYGTSPLGVSSTLAPATKDSFFEIGYVKNLFHSVEKDDATNSVSFIGTYGTSNDEIDATVGRLGLKYEKKSASSSFSLYAGVLRASAEIGIPGRHEVGRDRVSVSDDSLEMLSRYALRF